MNTNLKRRKVTKMSDLEWKLAMLERYRRAAGTENMLIAEMDIRAGRHGELLDRYDKKVLYTY